jgi:UDP-N-acetylglucosamine 2-epimerase (non-hydrolysing)
VLPVPKVMVVEGTRPEAIKLAPVIHTLESAENLDTVVVATGQHRTMLDQVNSLFGVEPRYDLDLLSGRPDLGGITAGVVEGMKPILDQERPDLLVVQGDTTTVFAAALAAFYSKIPVAHVEAGLRTGDPYNPYPEEMNRRLTTALTAVHLAPTPTSRANLLAEGVAPESIHVTGNTVIDALLEITSRSLPPTDRHLAGLAPGSRIVLVTSHRRENWGAPMEAIARAIARLAVAFPAFTFVLPAHLNPTVREALLPPLLGLGNVIVTEPVDYTDMAFLLDAATLVITDSGGVQEEAPSLGKPVLVLRDTTERPEAVTAGTVRLVGTDEDRVVAEATTLLTDPRAYERMAHAVNPYGDGRAAERIVGAIQNFFGLGPRPDEFVAGAAPAAD